MPTDRAALHEATTEADWQQAVVDYARLRGWRIHHQRPARMGDGGWRSAISGDKGWLDLSMARNGRLVLAELKREKGRLTDGQQLWIMALPMVPGVCETYVWRPSDWPEVVEVLA